MQLDALTALRTVALDGLVPESILIEEGCELHITQHTSAHRRRRVGHSLAPPPLCVGVRQRCCCHGAAACQGGKTYEGIAAGPSLWHHAVPLDGTLAQVDALVVQCKDLMPRARRCQCDAAWQQAAGPGTLRPLGERSRCFACYGTLPVSSAGQCLDIACFTQGGCLQGNAIAELSAILARRPAWDGHFCESGGA